MKMFFMSFFKHCAHVEKNSSVQIIKIGLNMFKLVQICPRVFKFVQTCPNLSKRVQTCPKVSKIGQIGLNI